MTDILLYLLLAAPPSAQTRSPAVDALLQGGNLVLVQDVGRASLPRAELAREIERKLTSTDPQTIAWGAFESGAHHVESAIPFLQRVLESPPALPDWPRRRALLGGVLDALIQLNARVPAPVLVQYLGEHPVETFVLLSNATGRDPVLIGLLNKTSGFRWFATANLLLGSRSPALATHLLETVRLRVTVTVTDTDGGPVTGDATGIGIGDGIGQTPHGYPPRAQYRFESSARSGAIVLAPGPQPVFYSRTITTAFQYGTSEVMFGGPSDRDRLAYIHVMLGPGRTPSLQAETIEIVRWTSPQDLLQRVEELRRRIETGYQFLRQELVRTYRLSSDAGPARPQLDIRLEDNRKDRSVPLPSVNR